MLAQIRGVSDFLSRDRFGRCHIGRTKMFDELGAHNSTSRRYCRSSISVISAKVSQPRLSVPRNPFLNACSRLPCSCAGSSLRNANEPVTTHSPGVAANSKTCLSELSSCMAQRNRFDTLARISVLLASHFSQSFRENTPVKTSTDMPIHFT